MRVVHISDTHLGFSAYKALDKDLGINQRETDIYKAFKEAVDKIIEIKPDLVVHAGDLFDSVRPSNKAISFAIEELLRLSQKNIPVVLIAGNHSTPKMHDTGSIFKLFTLFPGLYPVYKGKYEKIKIGKITVHAIPQSASEEELEKNFKLIKLEGNSSYNIMMLHAGITGIKEFSMGEFNEQLISEELLKDGFDYIALGHYHKFTQVKDNAYYSGSTERFSFSEVEQEKGFAEVNLKKKKIDFHSLNVRPMFDLKPIDASSLDTEALQSVIEKTILKNNPEDKIVRLSLNNIPIPVYNSLNFKEIRKLTSSALHFEIRHNPLEGKEELESLDAKIGSLNSEFLDYISAQNDLDKERKEKLRELGLAYLEKVVEE